jgi:7-cyano-7-deazaguanine synthase
MEPKMNSTLVILSGGIDSSTLLYTALERGDVVTAVTYIYGQRHEEREVSAAKSIAGEVAATHYCIDITGDGWSYGSSLTMSEAVPEGHYNDESMKSTVVPGRNLIFSIEALKTALETGCSQIALGVHSGDSHTYPDCRPRFVEALREVLAASECGISVWTPFLHMTKAEVAAEAIRLGVPINSTWTCYVGKGEPCGKCGACVSRMEALSLARKADDE